MGGVTNTQMPFKPADSGAALSAGVEAPRFHSEWEPALEWRQQLDLQTAIFAQDSLPQPDPNHVDILDREHVLQDLGLEGNHLFAPAPPAPPPPAVVDLPVAPVSLDINIEFLSDQSLKGELDGLLGQSTDQAITDLNKLPYYLDNARAPQWQQDLNDRLTQYRERGATTVTDWTQLLVPAAREIVDRHEQETMSAIAWNQYRSTWATFASADGYLWGDAKALIDNGKQRTAKNLLLALAQAIADFELQPLRGEDLKLRRNNLLDLMDETDKAVEAYFFEQSANHSAHWRAGLAAVQVVGETGALVIGARESRAGSVAYKEGFEYLVHLSAQAHDLVHGTEMATEVFDGSQSGLVSLSHTTFGQGPDDRATSFNNFLWATGLNLASAAANVRFGKTTTWATEGIDNYLSAKVARMPAGRWSNFVRQHPQLVDAASQMGGTTLSKFERGLYQLGLNALQVFRVPDISAEERGELVFTVANEGLQAAALEAFSSGMGQALGMPFQLPTYANAGVQIVLNTGEELVESALYNALNGRELLNPENVGAAFGTGLLEWPTNYLFYAVTSPEVAARLGLEYSLRTGSRRPPTAAGGNHGREGGSKPPQPQPQPGLGGQSGLPGTADANTGLGIDAAPIKVKVDKDQTLVDAMATALKERRKWVETYWQSRNRDSSARSHQKRQDILITWESIGRRQEAIFWGDIPREVLIGPDKDFAANLITFALQRDENIYITADIPGIGKGRVRAAELLAKPGTEAADLPCAPFFGHIAPYVKQHFRNHIAHELSEFGLSYEDATGAAGALYRRVNNQTVYKATEAIKAAAIALNAHRPASEGQATRQEIFTEVAKQRAEQEKRRAEQQKQRAEENDNNLPRLRGGL